MLEILPSFVPKGAYMSGLQIDQGRISDRLYDMLSDVNR
jgi:hypothetical protein